MKLELESKLNELEINELRKRVFSFAEQMFMEGLSTGRELNRELLQASAETFMKDRISYMTSYFVRDEIWEAMPPHGYNPNPNVPVREFIKEQSAFPGDVDTMLATAKAGDGMLAESVNINKPEWADKQEIPEWANKARPF